MTDKGKPMTPILLGVGVIGVLALILLTQKEAEEPPPPPPPPPDGNGNENGNGEEPPEFNNDTRPPENVTHDSATLVGEMNPQMLYTPYVAFFQYGRTTAYGQETPRTPGVEIVGRILTAELLHVLSPNTTYHYRLVAIREWDNAVFYAEDIAFTTNSTIVNGFNMRTTNWPIGADWWIAGFVGAGPGQNVGAWMDVPGGKLPIDAVWNWPYPVLDTERYFFINALSGPSDGPWVTLRQYEFDWRAFNGANYIFDYSTGMMNEVV